jgi:hypothetical protein
VQFGRNSSSALCLLIADSLFGLLFDPVDGSRMFMRNSSELLRYYSASHPKDSFQHFYLKLSGSNLGQASDFPD